MPKLYFRYGTMNSSKTANLLMVVHNYRSQNKKIITMKPGIDDRSGISMISSRAISGIKADYIIDDNFLFSDVDLTDVHCILVDEAQFLSEQNIDDLRIFTQKVPVICYGLRTDFTSKLFPGSKRLFEIADTIEEVKTICVTCDRKAIINAKFQIQGNKKTIIYNGDNQIDIGAEDKYQPLCWKCWYCKK